MQPPTLPLYAQATDPKPEKRKYKQDVPVMLYVGDKELHLPFVLETAREHAEIEQNAYSATLKSFGGKAPKSDEHSNWTTQMDYNRALYTIQCVCRTPTDLSKQWFNTVQEVADTYNPDELSLLMADYISIKRKQPLYKALSAESTDPYQDVIDQIIKDVENSDFFLNSLTTHAVNQLVKFLIVERQTYKNINGSSGLPSDNTTTTK